MRLTMIAALAALSLLTAAPVAGHHPGAPPYCDQYTYDSPHQVHITVNNDDAAQNPMASDCNRDVNWYDGLHVGTADNVTNKVESIRFRRGTDKCFVVYFYDYAPVQIYPGYYDWYGPWIALLISNQGGTTLWDIEPEWDNRISAHRLEVAEQYPGLPGSC